MTEYVDLADYLLIAEEDRRAVHATRPESPISWSPPSVDETVTTIEGVAAGEILEGDLADRLRRGLRPGS